MMKRLYVMTLLLMSFIVLSADEYQELWITGSAVPGGVQKLVKVSNNDFKYAGSLKEGDILIMTTKKVGKQTHYLAPVLADANIVNHGLAWKEASDNRDAKWQVVVAEDRYRFHVYTDRKILRGEIFHPWGELFIGGGATASGWKEGKMQLMNQDIDNPYLWTWEGELKRHEGIEEPASFKFQGQDRWHPKALHPYQADTDILTDKRLRIGGDDTKWTLSKDGIYRITIDLLNETVNATLVQAK